MTYEQQPVGREVTEQSRNNTPPAFKIKIDEHIAAENQIERSKPGKRRIVKVQALKADYPNCRCCLDLAVIVTHTF